MVLTVYDVLLLNTLVLKLSLSMSFYSIDRHLSLPQSHLLEFDQSVFGSHGGGSVGECDR